MDIRRRPGARHGNADSLSRYPCRQCGLTDDTETDSCSEVAASASVVNKATADVDPDSKNLNSLQDRDLSKIKSWVSDKKRPEFSDIKHESKVIKSLWSQWVTWKLKTVYFSGNGIITKRFITRSLYLCQREEKFLSSVMMQEHLDILELVRH